MDIVVLGCGETSALSFSLILSASNLLRKLFDDLIMDILPTEAVRGRFVRDMESVGKKKEQALGLLLAERTF